MGRFIFWLIIFYLLYKFITQFVLPIIGASQKIRTTMKDMQGNMHKQTTEQQPSAAAPQEKQTPVDKGEYIDFEEIK